MEEVYEFLKKAGTYYLATVEGDQPRVRPFGAIDLYDGKIYIQTGKVKDVSKQVAVNPKVEIVAFADGAWVRVAATLVDDPSIEAQEHMLAAFPSLSERYQAGDGNNQVLWLKDATATFASFTAAPKVITF